MKNVRTYSYLYSCITSTYYEDVKDLIKEGTQLPFYFKSHINGEFTFALEREEVTHYLKFKCSGLFFDRITLKEVLQLKGLKELFYSHTVRSSDKIDHKEKLL